MEEELLFFRGYGEALLGYGHCSMSGGASMKAIYSGAKILAMLEKAGMDHDEAMEYIMFNIEGAYAGPATPVVMWEFDEENSEVLQ
jgi:hypothetical protein